MKGGGINVAISVFKSADYTSLSKQLLRAHARAQTHLATFQECAKNPACGPTGGCWGGRAAADACNGATADTAAVMKADFKAALWH